MENGGQGENKEGNCGWIKGLKKKRMHGGVEVGGIKKVIDKLSPGFKGTRVFKFMGTSCLQV